VAASFRLQGSRPTLGALLVVALPAHLALSFPLGTRRLPFGTGQAHFP
jgi:hypothetical protein